MMKMKGLRGLFLAVLVFIVFFAASPVKAAEPIKLGTVLAVAQPTNQDLIKSMKLAIKQVNTAGGLLGRQLELIIYDDEMNPAKAPVLLEKLATEDKVDILVGGLFSVTTAAMVPVMKKHSKITVWVGGANSAQIEVPMEGQDWFFHMHAWDYQQIVQQEQAWVQIAQKYPKTKRKKVFFVVEDNTIPIIKFLFKSLGDAFGWELEVGGFKGVMQNQGKTGDYRPAMRKAKEYNPDMLLWIGMEKEAVPMMEAAKEVGFAPPLFLGSPTSWPADFAKNPLSEGVFLYMTWCDTMKRVSPESKAYSDAYNKEYKEAPISSFGPLGYTNIMVVADAIKKAGSLDKAALIKALEATRYKSPLGDTFIFGKSKVINHQAYPTMKIMKYQKGTMHVIWPWELATAKILYPFPGWGNTTPKEEPAPEPKKAKSKK